MAQPPPEQNFYHHTHPHPHPHAHTHPHPQLQLPPQFRNPFDLLFDDRTGTINYNYIRPYLPNQLPKPDELSDSLVMRRPRRTRTTFTSSQIAELEQHFLQGRYLTAPRLAELSSKLALGTAQVKIWFKNRRRRHKIQSDQNKDHSYDGMLSPTMSSMKGEVDPPSLQALSLNSNGGSTTPNPLTPSPTPTTPTAHLFEHYGDNAYNSYYYNGHHVAHTQASTRHSAHHSHASSQAHQYPSVPPNVSPASFYQSNALHHSQSHQNQPNQTQHAQAHPQHHQQQQQQQQQHQRQQRQSPQQYHTHHQFELHHKNPGGCRVKMIKDEHDFNFNNPYYMRMSTAPAAASVASCLNASVVNVVEPSSAMSPKSEVYEPLTPKNDENPSLCNNVVGGGNNRNGGTVEVADEMDRSNKKTLQTLSSFKANYIEKPFHNGNAYVNEQRVFNRVEGCTGAFAKYSKMQPSHESHESNYQCTMDTIMQAYNPHRNSSGNAQFAYCFN